MSVFRDVLKKITPFMKSRGFVRSGSSGRFYYVANDIAYCVTFEKPSILIYVTAYIMPLYVPTEYIYFDYGERLRHLHGLELHTLTENEPDLMEQWIADYCKAMDEKILPVFQQIPSPEALIGELENESPSLTWLFRCPQIHIEKLKMYTYFYLQRLPETEATIEHYCKELAQCDFLTKTCIQRYIAEADVVATLLHKSAKEGETFIADAIEHTKQFFKKAYAQ